MEYVTPLLFGWQWKGLEQVMDWVAVCSAVGAVVLLVVEIIRGVKEKQALSKEHECLGKEHNSLSKEHDGLSKEHNRLENSFNQRFQSVHEQIKEVGQITTVVNDKLTRNEMYHQNLTKEQHDIRKSIEMLTALENQMEFLQTENKELKEEIKTLIAENQKQKDRIQNLVAEKYKSRTKSNNRHKSHEDDEYDL